MTGTLTTRQKRFLTDLKKRLPVFPCDTSNCGLTYADLLKLDKRAGEVGVDQSQGGERLRWLRETLDSLERWASLAIEADQSMDIHMIRKVIESGESAFSRTFIRTVPLFKLVTRANRKRLKLLEEYESCKDEWLPVSMSTLPVSQLEGILREEDLAKLSSLYSRWDAFVSSGYFDLQAALELLRGVHEEDLRSHSSFPLLQKALKLLSLDLSKIDARPILVRVRPSVIAKLIAVVALSPAFGEGVEIPPTYSTEMRKAIERANDTQFRKICEPSVNVLLVRTYPQKVSGLLAFIHRPYGTAKPVQTRVKKSRFTSKKMESNGMRTRSSRTQSSDKPKPLKQVTLAVLQRTLKEGQRLLKLSRQDKEILKSVEFLEKEIMKIENQRAEIDALADGADLSTWIPIDVGNHELLWIFKLELDFTLRKLLSCVKDLKPCLFKDQLEGLKAAIYRLRIEKSLVNVLLNKEHISLETIEGILNSDPFGSKDSGILRFFSEKYAMLSSKLKQRIVGLSVPQLKAWLDSLSEISEISTENCESVVNAKFVLSEATELLESMARMFRALCVDADKLGLIHSAASKIVSKNLTVSLSVLLRKQDELSQVVELNPAWTSWLRAVDWAVRAQQKDLDINALIELHRQAEIHAIDQTALAVGDEEIVARLKDLETNVSTITSLIRSAVGGDFQKLEDLDKMGLVASEIERVKMDLEDYRARMVVVDNIRNNQLKPESISMTTLLASIESLSSFASRYEKAIQLEDLHSLVATNNSLPDLRTRDEVEQALSSLSVLNSEEIFRAKKNLEKTKDLESEIEQILKKSDSVNTSLGRLVELAESKYTLLKKACKLKIGLSQRGLRKLLSSLHATLCHLAQQTAVKPKWTHLFMLRSVGSFLQAQRSIQTWVSRQMDACTEILKDSKKSLADFARTRFMVPLFHISLFEPLEKIKQNMESKMGVTIMLNFAATERRLESVSTHDKEGRVKERIFPKLGGPSKSSLIEPESSSQVSELFEKRKPQIESSDQAVEQLILVAKAQLSDWREYLGHSSHKMKGSGGQSSDGQSGMSFTKFLSSSFSTLDIAPGTMAPGLDQMDELLASDSSKSYLDRYYELVENSKKASNPVSAPSTPRVERPVPEFKAPSALPGFAAPPKAASAIPVYNRPSPTPQDRVIVWKGEILGPKHAFRVPVSLVPLFKSPHANIVRNVLAGHQNWQYEGSLSIGKFSEHYGKLMHPAHRAKREPYSFFVASEQPDRVLESIPPNTASAFALIVAPYKIKLWIVCGDGSIAFQPLPLVPRLFFGFVEMPLPLLHNAGPLENIFEVSELASRANSVATELANLQLGSLIQAPEPEIHQPVQKVQKVETPTPQPSQAEDPLMSRVLHAFAQQKSIPEPLPVPVPRQAPIPQDLPPSWPQAPPPQPIFNPMAQYYARPIGAPSSLPSMVIGAPSSLVIGAPSAGASIEQFPNPKRGLCRFFNTSQGCQSGSRCRYNHACSVCGSEEHGAVVHDPPGPTFYRY